MQRRRLKPEAPNGGGLYFPDFAPGVKFISTGCTLLDCVDGGGWAEGRVANIVGDRSSGKTLLAIEACANFAQQHAKGKIFYREAEAAFDEPYAKSLGLPVARVDFGPDGLGTVWDTVEDIFEDLDAVITQLEKASVPGLYIIDSLDALSSRAELERKPGEATFGLEKQKMMGQLFRKLVRRMKACELTLIVISQIRDKIGVTFGEKHTRTGGKALDFYASQIIWLSHVSTLTQTRGGVKRATGVRIKAKCKKNKVALPFRDCEFVIRFGFGVEDLVASVEWLEEVKMLDKLEAKSANSYLDAAEKLPPEDYVVMLAEVRRAVFEAWAEIDKRFAPSRRKYAAN